MAGPNGSGKSTSYGNSDIEEFNRSIWIINPDLLAARIRDVEDLPLGEANLQAVIRIERWLEASIEAHQTVGVETVLSSPKYRRLVALAKTKGFEIRLIYVVLRSPDLSVERLRLRVLNGGHDVPEDKIRERYARWLEQMPWFLDQADRAWVLDNSGSEPRLIAAKEDGAIMIDPRVIPAVEAAIRTQG